MNASQLLRRFDFSLQPATVPGSREDEDELRCSDMLPYLGMYDDETAITKDDGLVQVIKLDGLYFESLSAEQIKRYEQQRNTVLRSIANSERGVYVHLVRRKIDVYPDGKPEAWFARAFDAAWRQRCERRSFYVNEIFLSVVRNRVRQGVPGLIDRVVNLARSSVEPDAFETEALEAQASDLRDATSLIVKALRPYGATLLKVQRYPKPAGEEFSQLEARRAVDAFGPGWVRFRADHGTKAAYPADEVLTALGPEHNPVASFFYYLVNLSDERVPATSAPLDVVLANSRINTRLTSNLLEVQGPSGTRACAVMSMAEWPARTSSQMLADFLSVPCEFVLTQSFFFLDRISAEQDMRQEQRRLVMNDTTGQAAEDAADLTQGLADLSRGRMVSGLHHLSILVHLPVQSTGDAVADRRRAVGELDEAVGVLGEAFVRLGVKSVRETLAAETFFWSQLPGQAQHLMGRRGRIKSANFAGFASLHNYASGRMDGNLWGPAVMLLETVSGTPYAFNFHREMDGMVAGHTAVVADTGAGKTTFLSATIAMADKFKPRVFWFDNREGAKVFMAAMGGTHTTLSAQGDSGWNPFQLPDTPENRAYLVELLGLMRCAYGGKLTPLDVEAFKSTVHEAYQLPQQDRRMRNVAWCFGQGELAQDMRVWHGANGQRGQNAGVFDNASDSFDLSRTRYHCFEMRQLIKDGVARPELPVLLSYPFHRIEQAMNGEPFILVLEEGQNLVRHEYWRLKIDAYIMQIRRKNGVLIFVTPDAKYLYCETDSIAKQAVTKIFLPNAEARRADYVEQLGLTAGEYDFVRDTPPELRRFLVRRGRESVKAVFDLSELAEFIPVLSSNDRGVALMERVIEELGTSEPSRWVPEFMRRARSANTHNLGA